MTRARIGWECTFIVLGFFSTILWWIADYFIFDLTPTFYSFCKYFCLGFIIGKISYYWRVYKEEKSLPS